MLILNAPLAAGCTKISMGCRSHQEERYNKSSARPNALKILIQYKNDRCFYRTYSQCDVCAGPPELSHRRNMSDASQTGAVHRTDSPDNDSAFSDSVSLLSSESSASSGRTDTHSHSQVVIVLLLLLYHDFVSSLSKELNLAVFTNSFITIPSVTKI